MGAAAGVGDGGRGRRDVARAKYDILSVPFALVWQFSILMLPLLLMVRQYRSSAVVGAMLAVALTGLYFFWYKLPPA